MDLLASGALLAALGLGVTHGLEPDHAAGITGLTAAAPSPRRGALAGAGFAMGHVALVVGWVAVGSLLVDTADLAGVGGPGSLVAGTALVGLGSILSALAVRSLLAPVEHEHADGRRHTHLALPGVADAGPRHGHGSRWYLGLAAVGAAFTLSPPLSMLAFLATVGAEATVALVPLVAAYGLAITATMAGVGAVVGTGGDRLRAAGTRPLAVARLAAGVAVAGLGATLVV